MDRINQVIADLVADMGETDKAIAKRLGISPQLLGQYKSGKKKPGFAVIQKWSAAFNQDLVKIASQDETIVSRESQGVISTEQYKEWINDERVNSAHLRELNLKFVEIISVLSNKVGAGQNA